MLGKLSPPGSGPAAPTVVLDAGIASEENIAWLVAHGCHYQSLRKFLHGVEATVGGREPAVELTGTYLQRVAEAPYENIRDD